MCEHLFKFAKESGIESVVLLGEDHSQLPMSYLMSFGFEPEQPYGYIAYMPESGQDNSGPALGGTGISKMNLQ